MLEYESLDGKVSKRYGEVKERTEWSPQCNATSSFINQSKADCQNSIAGKNIVHTTEIPNIRGLTLQLLVRGLE